MAVTANESEGACVMARGLKRQRKATNLEALRSEAHIREILAQLADRRLETDEERSERVAKIKAQVAAGEYEIKSEAIAVALIF